MKIDFIKHNGVIFAWPLALVVVVMELLEEIRI